MPQKRSYPSWLAPLYKNVPLARFLYWQSRFLTDAGVRKLTHQLLEQTAEQVTFERKGVRWTVDLRDHGIGLALFMGEQMDRLFVGYMLDWARTHGRLPQCDTILDIGANIGTTTIPFLQETVCRVVCVEPVPSNLALLKQNLQQNHLLERATIVERAITDRAEIVNMLVTLTTSGGSEVDRGATHLPEGIFQQATESVPVTTTRLDDLITSLALEPAQIAFVWCDVQGSEGAVVRTGAPLWAQGVPLWAEIAPLPLARHGEIPQFLADLATHFHSYITLRDFANHGPQTSPQPIETLPAFVATLTGEEQSDVLFLPRSN